MAARSRWLASYSAIASLEVYCKICSRLILSIQNSAYPMPANEIIKMLTSKTRVIRVESAT